MNISVPPEIALTQTEQQELEKMFNTDKLKEYFEKNVKKVSSEKRAIIEQFVNKLEKQFEKKVAKGSVQINQIRTDVNQLMLKQQQKKQQQIKQQQQKMIDLKSKRHFIQQQLKYLDNQTSLSKSTVLSPDIKFTNVYSKQQHQKIIEKFKQQRQQMNRKHSQILRKIQMQEEQKAKRSATLQVQRKNQILTQRRKKVEQSLMKHKKQHQQFINHEKQSKKIYEEVKKKKFLYETIQQRYRNDVVGPMLQEKKKRLKQIRDLHKAYNTYELNLHQRAYLDLKQSHQKESQVKQQESTTKWSYKPPQKSQKLAQILQEQKLQVKRKLQEKKRLIDEKISRQNQFISDLKVKFIPRIDQSKRQQIESRIKAINTHKRQPIDERAIGLNYLQISKKKRKKIDIQQRSDTQRSVGIQSKQNKSTKVATNYLQSNRPRQQYQQLRRKKMDRIKNSSYSKADKLLNLQREADKISQTIKQKQQLLKFSHNEQAQEDAVELILSSIKAKMDIIDIYKK